MTKDSLNLLSYGGGNEYGAWSLAAVQAVADSSNLDAVIALKYDGIVIDAEVYASGQTVTVAQWNDMFVAIKAKGLLLIVTISHFSPYGMPNGNELVADWLLNPLIDYLSPQLYTTGTEPQNDWVGFSQAWVTASTPIAPSIVQASYYDQLGSNSVTAYLPNAKGYLVWSNTSPPQPGPIPTCVSGYFPVRT
jgi:chitinase